MADAPPPHFRGRAVAILLIAAVAIAIAGMLYMTRPGANANDTVAAPPPDPQPLSFYLARADAVRGAAFFQRCSYCHTISPGSPHGIGPNLYGVMGGRMASRPGFAYSEALREKSGTWDWDSANRFLQSPLYFVPRTKMNFAGVSSPQDRADVMLYLNQQGGSLALPAGGPPAR